MEFDSDAGPWSTRIHYWLQRYYEMGGIVARHILGKVQDSLVWLNVTAQQTFERMLWPYEVWNDG